MFVCQSGESERVLRMEETSEKIIEHVVLLNIREGEDSGSRVNQMVSALNALHSLDGVLYLTAGPILRIRSSSLDADGDGDGDGDGDADADADVKLSHMVHARFRSEPELAACSSMVDQLVRPICDRVLAVDWVVDALDRPLAPKPGSALRLTLLSLKQQQQRPGQMEGVEMREKDEGLPLAIMLILEGLRRMKAKWKSNSDNPLGFEQISFGQNIIQHRKGEESESESESYDLAALVVFRDLNELDACEEYEDELRSLLRSHKIISGSLILDYVLPRLHSIS